MSEHIAKILWKRTSEGFGYEEYNHRHLWRFDAGFVSRVDLRPRITFSAGTNVDSVQLKKMHHDAYEHCFIANPLVAKYNL